MKGLAESCHMFLTSLLQSHFTECVERRHMYIFIFIYIYLYTHLHQYICVIPHPLVMNPEFVKQARPDALYFFQPQIKKARAGSQSKSR